MKLTARQGRREEKNKWVGVAVVASGRGRQQQATRKRAARAAHDIERKGDFREKKGQKYST